MRKPKPNYANYGFITFAILEALDGTKTTLFEQELLDELTAKGITDQEIIKPVLMLLDQKRLIKIEPNLLTAATYSLTARGKKEWGICQSVGDINQRMEEELKEIRQTVIKGFESELNLLRETRKKMEQELDRLKIQALGIISGNIATLEAKIQELKTKNQE